YDAVFRQLRNWYLRAAGALASATSTEADLRWSPARGLANHVLIALVRGAASIGDSDHLVEKTFAAVSPEVRSEIYSDLYQSWSASEEPIPEAPAARLAEFWEWRVHYLESLQKGPELEKEAAGLMYFLSTPYLPAADAIRLGQRTMRLSTVESHTRAQAWERLGELAVADAAGA